MREGVYMGGVCTRERYEGEGTYDPGMGRESILIGQDTTAIPCTTGGILGIERPYIILNTYC